MVEVRDLSVALSVTAIWDGVKGNAAEIYIFAEKMYIGLQENILQTVTLVERFRGFKLWYI